MYFIYTVTEIKPWCSVGMWWSGASSAVRTDGGGGGWVSSSDCSDSLLVVSSDCSALDRGDDAHPFPCSANVQVVDRWQVSPSNPFRRPYCPSHSALALVFYMDTSHRNKSQIWLKMLHESASIGTFWSKGKKIPKERVVYSVCTTRLAAVDCFFGEQKTQRWNGECSYSKKSYMNRHCARGKENQQNREWAENVQTTWCVLQHSRKCSYLFY